MSTQNCTYTFWKRIISPPRRLVKLAFGNIKNLFLSSTVSSPGTGRRLVKAAQVRRIGYMLKEACTLFYCRLNLTLPPPPPQLPQVSSPSSLSLSLSSICVEICLYSQLEVATKSVVPVCFLLFVYHDTNE